MAREIPLFDQSFECHKDIGRLVAARIKPEIRVRFTCSLRTCGAKAEKRAFIDILELYGANASRNLLAVKQEIGIPIPSLVPEKVAPIAYWLIREFRKQRPDLFQEGDVIELPS